MSTLISGVLIDAIGNPIKDCTIELKAERTGSTVIAKTIGSEQPGDDGSYSMQVEPNKYRVTLCIEGRQPEYVGNIVVYVDSAPGSLNDFLCAVTEDDLTPEAMKHFEELAAQAAVSAADAKTSEDNAADSATTAAVSETNAANSEDAAAQSAVQAAISAESVASDTEAAATSAIAAKASEDSAATSAAQATASAESIAGDVAAAAESATQAAASAENAASDSETATASATAAKVSEKNAATSAADAKTSEDNAADSATAAAESQSAAATSETNAADSETAAALSATQAADSAESIAGDVEAAATSAAAAKTSEDNAATSASDANDAADRAEAAVGMSAVETDGVSILGDGKDTPLHLPFWQPDNRASYLYNMAVPFGPQGDPALKSSSYLDTSLNELLGFSYPKDGGWGTVPAFFYLFDPLTRKLWVTLWVSADLELLYPILSIHGSSAVPEILARLQETEPTLTKDVLLQRFTDVVNDGDVDGFAVGDVVVNHFSNGMASSQESQTEEALQSCREQFVSFINWWGKFSGNTSVPGDAIVETEPGIYKVVMPCTGLWGNSFLLKSNQCARWEEQSRDDTQITWCYTQYQPGWQEDTGQTTTTPLDGAPTDYHWYRSVSASGAREIDATVLPFAGTKQLGVMYSMRGGDEDIDFKNVNPALVAITLDKYQQRPPLNYAMGNWKEPSIGGLVFASITNRPTKGSTYAGTDLSQVLIGYDPASPTSLQVMTDGPASSSSLPGTYQSLSGCNAVVSGYAYISLFARIA